MKKKQKKAAATRQPAAVPVLVRTVRSSAQLDLARTTDENRRHFALADGLDADATFSPEKRRVVRNRCRYEVLNNSYARGIGLTIANDTVGTGPQLQVLTDDKDANTKWEMAFWKWAVEIRLAEKLRQMRFALYDTGEVFVVFVNNPGLRSPVKLDIELIEAEQIADPTYESVTDPNRYDGIGFDQFGNPSFYRKLRQHPGSLNWTVLPNEYDDLEAADVFHYFHPTRPGQRRGIPDITPACQLFAELRRYSAAVIAAAETAADFSAVLYSEAPPDPEGGATEVASMDTVELARRMATTLPQGWKLGQIHAEQPTTTYAEFVATKLKEIARCINVPFTVAAMDASVANMSAAYADRQPYAQERRIDREDLEVFLARLLRGFVAEARGIDGYLPPIDPNFTHAWYWPSLGHHADPQKVANARSTDIAAGMTTRTREYLKEGLDIEEQDAAGAKENNMTVEEYREAIRNKNFGLTAPQDPQPNPDDEDSMTKPMPVARRSRARMMRAESTKPCDVKLQAEAVIVEAAADDSSPPKFSMTAYTGVAMRPNLKPPLPHPVVIDLAGVDLSRQNRPALKDHDSTKLVGHTLSISTDGKSLMAAGVISGAGEAAKEVVGAAKNGFEWPVSVGASLANLELIRAGQTASVNGRVVSGPVFIARSSRLHEISFLSMAADEDASATIAAQVAAEREVPMDFQTWLAAMGLSFDSLTDEQKTKLEAKFAAETAAKAGATSSTTATAVNSGGLDAVLKATREKEAKTQKIVDLTAAALQEHPGKLGIIEALSRQAIDGGWDTQRYELELLRATRPQASVSIRASSDEGLTGEVIEAAICLGGGIDSPEKHFDERVLTAAQKRWKNGLALGETLLMFARQNGYDGFSMRSLGPVLKAAFAQPRMMLASASTISLPGILSNVANKFLRIGFESVESSWRMIAAIRPVKDFKQITSYSLVGDFDYKEIPAGGKLEHAEPGELSYSNQAKSFGRMLGIDRRDLINDDIGALTTAPKRLGRGGATKLNNVFWTAFLDNSSFFATGNANYLEGATAGTNDTRMNIEGLTRAETLFFDQTDPNGFPMAATGKYLLVPNALHASAMALMNSTEVRDTTASTKIGTANPHAGKWTVVRSAYLSNSAITGYSAAAWYLLADPNDVPVIEVAFLNGVEAPTVESADADFDTLGIQMRGFHDFGVTKQEYRGGVKMKGAA